MKKSNAFFTAGITLMILCITLIPESNPDLQKSKSDFHYSYEHGQVIYPECEGGDTLVVRDAIGLNAALQNIHDHLDLYPYGDAQYDSVFNSYCIVDNSPIEYDYKLNIYNDTMWLYTKDNIPVGRVISKYDSPLDSLIIKDNQ